MTLAASRHTGSFTILWLFVLVCAGFVIHFATIDQTMSHAVLKHGAMEAQQVRDCISDPNLKQYRLQVRDSKYIDVCDQFNTFGFLVMLKYGGSGANSKWSELTAYVRDEIHSLLDLKAFAQTNGLDLFERIGSGPEATLIKLP